MKKLLLICAVTLGFVVTACAPLLSAVTPGLVIGALPTVLQYAQGEKAELHRDGASLVFMNADATAAQQVSIQLDGVDSASTGGVACLPAGTRSFKCFVGDVPGLAPSGLAYSYRVVFTGTLRGANAAFYRAASGNRPILIQLK